MFKKGQGLSINMIIIAIVVLVVLVVLVMIFTGYFAGFSKQIEQNEVKKCSEEGGTLTAPSSLDNGQCPIGKREVVAKDATGGYRCCVTV